MRKSFFFTWAGHFVYLSISKLSQFIFLRRISCPLQDARSSVLSIWGDPLDLFNMGSSCLCEKISLVSFQENTFGHLNILVVYMWLDTFDLQRLRVSFCKGTHFCSSLLRKSFGFLFMRRTSLNMTNLYNGLLNLR